MYNSSIVEAELDALEERLRLLQSQADEDARLIHTVSLISIVRVSYIPHSSLHSFTRALRVSNAKTACRVFSSVAILKIYDLRLSIYRPACNFEFTVNIS